MGALEQKVMTVAPVNGSMARWIESLFSIRWYHRASDTEASEVPSEIMRIMFFTGRGCAACPFAKLGESSSRMLRSEIKRVRLRKCFISSFNYSS